ncbi:YkgJ family cysteine cluster protein [Persephonella sp.]
MEAVKQLVLASAYMLNQPEIVEEVIDLQKKLNSQIDRFVGKQTGLACEKGCSYCCFGWKVSMSISELMLMVYYLNRLPAEKKISAAEKIVQFSKLDSYEGVPCPLLENSLCLVYAGRPFICRVYSSYSKKLCEEGNRIPFPPFVEKLIEQVVKPFENSIEEPFSYLFTTKTDISNIKYADDYFFIDLVNTARVIPADNIKVEPLEYAFKYLDI